MIHKLTKRSRLQDSAWLASLRTVNWCEIRPPEPDGLGIQASDFAQPMDGDSVGRKISELFQNLVDASIDPVSSDGQMSAGIHRILHGITHREAADPDFWAYLVSFGCPQYPRWRWPQEKADLRNRYGGSVRRNAFASLWWWAEATHNTELPVENPDRYFQTRHVKGRTTFVLFCVDCLFAGHNTLVRKLCAIQQEKELGDSDAAKLCRSVNRMAKIVCLDGLGGLKELSDFGKRAYELSAHLR